MKSRYLSRAVIPLLAILYFLAVPPLASSQDIGAEFVEHTPPPQTISYHNYANLSELLTILCDEANLKFNNFYGPGIVTVEPFITIDQFQIDKISKLGITLADQMIYVINNDTFAQQKAIKGGGVDEQRLNGILQEVDGYLRVHISGINDRGQRVSYVTNVEMSEPIYRALHTTILALSF